jgi:hypothetical protein
MKLIKKYKKGIAKILTLLMFIPMLNSCTSNENTIEDLESEVVMKSNTDLSKITENMILELGDLHNNYLIEAFDNYD